MIMKSRNMAKQQVDEQKNFVKKILGLNEVYDIGDDEKDDSNGSFSVIKSYVFQDVNPKKHFFYYFACYRFPPIDDILESFNKDFETKTTKKQQRPKSPMLLPGPVSTSGGAETNSYVGEIAEGECSDIPPPQNIYQKNKSQKDWRVKRKGRSSLLFIR